MPKNADFGSISHSDEEPTSTALTRTDTQAVAETGETDGATRVFSSSLDFDESDVLIPGLRLAQALTPEVINGQADAGQWVLTGAEPADFVLAIPVQWSKSREYRLKDENELLCWSSDGKVGRGQYGVGSHENPTGACNEATCPAARWTENKKTGRNNKPLCAQIYSFVLWDITHQSFVSISLKSTAIQAGKLINTMARSSGWGNFAIKLTSTQQKTPKGTYYVPNVAIAQADEAAFATARLMLAGSSGSPAPVAVENS